MVGRGWWSNIMLEVEADDLNDRIAKRRGRLAEMVYIII